MNQGRCHAHGVITSWVWKAACDLTTEKGAECFTEGEENGNGMVVEKLTLPLHALVISYGERPASCSVSLGASRNPLM